MVGGFRSCAGCHDCGPLGQGLLSGLGVVRGLTHVGGEFLHLRGCLLCLHSLQPPSPKGSQRAKGAGGKLHSLSAYGSPSTWEIVSHYILSTSQKV